MYAKEQHMMDCKERRELAVEHEGSEGETQDTLECFPASSILFYIISFANLVLNQRMQRK